MRPGAQQNDLRRVQIAAGVEDLIGTQAQRGEIPAVDLCQTQINRVPRLDERAGEPRRLGQTSGPVRLSGGVVVQGQRVASAFLLDDGRHGHGRHLRCALLDGVQCDGPHTQVRCQVALTLCNAQPKASKGHETSYQGRFHATTFAQTGGGDRNRLQLASCDGRCSARTAPVCEAADGAGAHRAAAV
ncbi:hypothetical protein THICB3180008 [Thiomonas sp. CB3]|nr:hypothetical protein THICB3180008 [Thiomonas sp. CB3]